MEIETLNAKSRFLKRKQVHDFSNLKFDLATLVENMKHSNGWVKGDLISMILLNRPGKQILLTALHEKTEVNSFQSMESVTFEIIEGKLGFRTLKESVILTKGQLLKLHENIEYGLIAIEETVFLLTIIQSSLIKQKTK